MLLDQLLAQLQGGQQNQSSDWQQRMLQQMSGGPISPSPIGYGGPVSPSPAPSAPMTGPQQRLGGPNPASAASTGTSAPAARRVAPAGPAGASASTYLSGALQGAAQGRNPLGMLVGGLAGAMGAGEAVQAKNDTYNALAGSGTFTPEEAALAIKNPAAFEMIAARKQEAAKQAAADRQKNATVAFLMRKHNMSPEDAAVVASNPAVLQKFLTPAAGGVVNPQSDPANYKVVDGRLVFIGPQGPTDATPARERTKLDDKKDEVRFKADVKRMNELNAEADTVSSLLGNLDRLEVARGGYDWEGPIVGRLMNISDKATEIDAVATEVQLEFTQKTKGAITENEMRLFRAATPDTKMRDAAATNVIQGMRMMAARKQGQAEFFEAYEQTHGNLNGAQGAWQAFITDNPLITRSPNGDIAFNPQAVTGWENYLDWKRPGVGAAQPAAPQGASQAAAPTQPRSARAPAPTASGKSRIIGVE